MLEPIGNIPPAEAKANFYAALQTEVMAAQPTLINLRKPAALQVAALRPRALLFDGIGIKTKVKAHETLASTKYRERRKFNIGIDNKALENWTAEFRT